MKNLFIWLILTITLSASYTQDMAVVTQEIVDALNITRQTKITISTVEADRNYMLPLRPVFRSLQKEMKLYAKEVVLAPVKNQGKQVIGELLRTSKDNIAVDFSEDKIHTLFLTGKYVIDEKDEQVFHKVNSSTTFMAILRYAFFVA